MKIEMRYIVGLVALAIVILGCKKEAGEGGTSSIHGKIDIVYRVIITNPTPADTSDAFDTEVYINYGDEIGPNDRIRTNYRGEYEFLNLRPGKYTIYVYSRDTLSSHQGALFPENMVVKQEVTIDSKKQEVQASLMHIYDIN